ncbi:hypothetical protein [Orenia marismortui]|uniref:hypothetical protein n=1 Tax=Orenia marismortui TaxID=46469 RepID=UPI00036BD2CE|nr:hypothetical protein [Orenia marismortui]
MGMLSVRGLSMKEQGEKLKKAREVEGHIIERLKETNFTVRDCIVILDEAKATIQSASKEQTIESLNF